VAVVDIDGDRAGPVANGITGEGGTAIAVQADLSQEPEVVSAVAAVVAQYGRLDVLHNNAALTESDFLSRDTQVTDLALDVWEQTMAVNLRSQMLTCKHAIPEMVRHGGGSIINMSSGASLKGDRTRTAYGVSKAGVNTLTMYVATSHGKQGVRVNTIVPGLIITDAVRAHLTDRMLAGLGKATLTPYVGEPEDVAHLVVFLASDESRYITGQMIAIDGGMSAHVGSAGQDDR
jgi:NAD(P)-dependent dehydrogenase (short-subunit alcohol dehydrogenase family)